MFNIIFSKFSVLSLLMEETRLHREKT